MEDLQFFTIVILAYCWPLIIGIVAVWFYRNTIAKEDSYIRELISGLIMLWASREFFRNFRTTRKR